MSPLATDSCLACSEWCNAERHTTCQRHHEICDRRRAARCGLERMFVKSWPGTRAESRLHPSQRRRASEGQLHASHINHRKYLRLKSRAAGRCPGGSGADPYLGHSADWREANERLDQYGNAFAPSFRVRQWQSHGPAPPSSRTRSAQPCSSSFPSASSLCGFTIVGPRSKRASELNGCMPCRRRPRVQSAPSHAVTCQKTRSAVPRMFSEDSDLRLQDRQTEQAFSGRGNDF